jgi:hypothetical protein
MSSTAPDKHPALVKKLKTLCEKHKFTCPTARKYSDILNTGVYTEEDLNELIELFAVPCDMCSGPHSLNHCPILQGETECPYCEETFPNSHMFNKHLDPLGNCPCSIECANCGERHYTFDCPWCMECAKKSNECKCKSHESVPSSLAPTTL